MPQKNCSTLLIGVHMILPKLLDVKNRGILVTKKEKGSLKNYVFLHSDQDLME